MTRATDPRPIAVGGWPPLEGGPCTNMQSGGRKVHRNVRGATGLLRGQTAGDARPTERPRSAALAASSSARPQSASGRSGRHVAPTRPPGPSNGVDPTRGGGDWTLLRARVEAFVCAADYRIPPASPLHDGLRSPTRAARSRSAAEVAVETVEIGMHNHSVDGASTPDPSAPRVVDASSIEHSDPSSVAAAGEGDGSRRCRCGSLIPPERRSSATWCTDRCRATFRDRRPARAQARQRRRDRQRLARLRERLAEATALDVVGDWLPGEIARLESLVSGPPHAAGGDAPAPPPGIPGDDGARAADRPASVVDRVWPAGLPHGLLVR